jgi:2'-5' RNA ligase
MITAPLFFIAIIPAKAIRENVANIRQQFADRFGATRIEITSSYHFDTSI